MKNRTLPGLADIALLTAGFLTSLPAGAEEAAAKVFAAPKTIVFVGDSITQNGRYQHVIQLALAARYPGQDFWTENRGWNGQEAEQAEARWDWDVMPAGPEVVFIHFGMNDVKRDGYKNGETPPQDRRDFLAERYRKALDSLIVKASGEGRQVVLLSPTLFDSTQLRNGAADNAELEKELVRYTQIAQELAVAHKLPFVDLQTPMRTVTIAMQARDPKAGFTPDGVHPNEAGH